MPRRARPLALLALEDRLAPATLTPDQVRHAYGVDAIPKFNGTITADGAGQTIAIVDAYDNPTVAADLAQFDTTYGTTANGLNARAVGTFFTKVNQTGGASLPASNSGWAGEIALDVEWAHAIAPMANIVLVECTNAGGNNLEAGVAWAAAHAAVVSNSWGGGEYSGETTEDSTYYVNPQASGSPGVAILFSSGDSGDISYPSASRNVLSVGATNLTVNASNAYSSETAWAYSGGQGGGGGTSGYEGRPGYQDSVASVVGTHRGTPDVSLVGGSGSPVWVYSSYAFSGWAGVWGTSASCPMWAGLISLVDQGRALAGLQPYNTPVETGTGNLTSYQLQTNLYALAARPAYYAADFHDVTTGANAYGQSAGTGYDLVTGLGTAVANTLVPDLVGYSTTAAAVQTTNPTPYGPITLTATVSGPMVTPTGSVNFKYGATVLGTAAVSGSGVATLSLSSSPLPPGSDVITAYYLGDANYAASSGTTTATLGQLATTTTVSVAPTGALTYGQSATLTATVGGTGSPTGTVTFAVGSLTLGTVTLSGGTATLSTTALPAGADTITATYSGDTADQGSSGTTGRTVTPATLTVTANPRSKVYGAALPTLTYAAAGLVNGDTAAAVLSGALATTAAAGSNAGGYPISRGTLAAGSNYTLAFTGNTLTVTAAPLTLTADAVAKAYGAALPTLTYTVSGLVNGDTAAAVTGAPATAATAGSGVGSYPITVGTLAATANYAVTFTGNTLTVTGAALTVTAAAAAKVYGAALPTLAYTASGFLNGDTAATALTGALATAAAAGSGVGGYAVTRGTLAAANYTITFTGSTLTVTPAALTVTADPAAKVYGAAVPGLTYVAAGLVNNDTAATALAGALATAATAGSGVGTFPITRGTLAAANYTVTFTGNTLTVTPAALSVTANPAAKLYGAAVPGLTYAATGLVNGDTAATALLGAPATTATAGSGVGGYAITAGTLAAANYAITFTGSTLTVTPAALTVTADPAAKVYGAAVPALTDAATGFVNGDTPALLAGTPATAATAASGVGSYPITQGTLAAGANYTITFTGSTLTVTPAALAVAADPAAKVYGSALPTLTYAVTGLVNGDTAAVVSGAPGTAATAASGVGSYPISAGTLAPNGNYTLAFTGNTLAVTPAPLAVTPAAAAKVYGAAVPGLAVDAAGLVNGDTVSTALTGAAATAATAASHVGGYAVTRGTLAAANYAVTFTDGTLAVTPAALAVTAYPAAKVYGAALPGFAYAVTGLVNGDTAAAVVGGAPGTTATAGSGVGTYAITAGTLATDADYTLGFTGNTLAVTPAALAVAADPETKVYGSAVPTLTYAVTGLVNGDTAAAVGGAASTAATAASGVGTYAVGRGSLAAANYAITFAGNTLTVTPAALTVTADPATKVYGAALPALTVHAAGLVNGDTAAAAFAGRPTTPATAASPAGSYGITRGTLAPTANYTLTFAGAALTVTPAPLAVAAAPQTAVYGAAPALTYTAAGFVNGDTPAVLSGSPAAATHGVGFYPITRGTLAAANYAVTFTPAVLTVTPAPLAVTAVPAAKVYGAAVPALAVSAPGLVNGDTVATAFTGTPATAATAGSGVGLYPVTRGTLAAANYAVTFADGTLAVTPAVLTVAGVPAAGRAAESIPPLTYTVTGLVNGDTPAVVTGVTLSAPATLDSPPGVYPIAVTGGTAANYVVTAAAGPAAGALTLAPGVNLLGATGFAAGADAGTPPAATLYAADGTPKISAVVFDPAATGGVRVAVADFNRDGTPDLVVGTGPGVPTLVRVIDGASGTELFRVEPFEASFTGGVYVAAGNLGADGRPELVVTPDEGGGPRVEVFALTAAGPARVANFYGIDDPNFRGGARAAVADITGDGRADLVVAAGFGGGPRVTGFDGTAVGGGTTPAPLFDRFVFEQTLRNGVFVTAGDLDGDGRADLVVGGGPGGGPRVLALSGRDLVLAPGSDPAVLANLFAGNPDSRGGVRVAAKDLDGDGRADLVTGDGASGRVTTYRGAQLAAGDTTPADAFDATPGGVLTGVFVG